MEEIQPEVRKPELHVSQEMHTARIMMLMILVFGLGAVLFATLTFRDIRSRASVPKPTPESLVSLLPSPRTALRAPYIRLVTAKEAYSLASQIPVEVYLATDGLPIVETYLSLEFDPTFLSLSEANIEKTQVFKSVESSVHEESLTISFFINPELGHTPVIVPEEVKIATLYFKSKTLSTDNTVISIDYEAGNLEKTAIFGENARENAENLLESVENTSFAITE